MIVFNRKRGKGGSMENNTRKIRLQKGFTQKQIAEKLNVSGAAVAQWEKTKNLRPATAHKIAGALGCSVAEIYGMNDSDTAAYKRIERRIVELEKEIKTLANDPYMQEAVKAAESELDSLYATLAEMNQQYGADIYTAESLNDIPILKYYMMLNSSGKTEAVKRVEELTMIPRYQAGSDPDPEQQQQDHSVPDLKEQQQAAAAPDLLEEE